MEKVRVVSTVDSPFANECFSEFDKCARPGVEIEYLYMALHSFLRKEVEWIKVDSYEDMYDWLNRGDADVLGISHNLEDYFLDFGWRYSPIFLYDAYVLLVKETVAFANDSFGVFKVFNWTLWLVLFLSTCTYMLFSWISGRLSDLIDKSNKPFLDFQWARDKMLQALWLVILGLFMSVFTNVMSIELIMSKKVSLTPFQSFEEFQAKLISGECRWVLPQIYEEDFELWAHLINPSEENPHPWAQGFRDAYAVNKPFYVESRDDIADKVINSESCFVGLDYASVVPYYNSRYCGIKAVPEMPFRKTDVNSPTPQIAKLPTFNYVYYFNPNSTHSLLGSLESVFATSSMQRLYDFLAKKYYVIPHPPACKSQFNAPEWEPMKIGKILGCFVLLASTLAFTLPIFSMELLTNRAFPRRPNKVRQAH